eukprot:1185994-Prorocentrum_minimum.AAC.2
MSGCGRLRAHFAYWLAQAQVPTLGLLGCESPLWRTRICVPRPAHTYPHINIDHLRSLGAFDILCGKALRERK